MNKKNTNSLLFEKTIDFLNNPKLIYSNYKIIINTIILKDIFNYDELKNLIEFANERNMLIIFWEVLDCNKFTSENFMKSDIIYDYYKSNIILREQYRWFYIYTLKNGRKFGIAKCLCNNFCIQKPSQLCINYNGIHITPNFKIKKCMFSSDYIEFNDLITRNDTLDINKLKAYLFSN